MKKKVAMLLAALLLLGGCSTRKEVPSTEISQSPESSGSDPAGSESPSAEPLITYSLTGTCTGFVPMGEHYLQFGSEAIALLTKDLTAVLTEQIPGLPDYGSGLIWVRDTGIAYFDASARDLVYLGTNLAQTSRLHFPDDMTGSAVLGPDWTVAYYCTADAIRALDLATGVSRVLKKQSPASQSLDACLLGGRLLRCQMMLSDGSKRTILVSAQTGETVAEGSILNGLCAGSENYFASFMNGSVREYIFGTYGEEPRNFWPPEDTDNWLYLPESNGLLGLTAAGGGIRVDLYDLCAGTLTASTVLEGAQEICFARGEGKLIWLLDGSTLYRWNPALSPAGDGTVYTAHHYTAEEPDIEGLNALELRLRELEETYGVDILIWEDAMAVCTEAYDLSPEYLTQAYGPALDTLERALGNFPGDFFSKAAQWTDSDTLHIALVREIVGHSDSGTLAAADGLFYNLEGKACIALPMGDDLERKFYHQMSHAMESRILSRTTAFYEWNTLNPSDFQYTETYVPNADLAAYAEGDGRSFLDLYSMSFPREDRARIFEYACTPGNEEYFRSDIIQKKLSRICDGIRKAYSLAGDSYLWEQYLQ